MVFFRYIRFNRIPKYYQYIANEEIRNIDRTTI